MSLEIKFLSSESSIGVIHFQSVLHPERANVNMDRK